MSNIEKLTSRILEPEYICWNEYLQSILQKRSFRISLQMDRYKILSTISFQQQENLQISGTYTFIGNKPHLLKTTLAFDKSWELLTSLQKEFEVITGTLSLFTLVSNDKASKYAKTLREQYKKCLTNPRFS